MSTDELELELESESLELLPELLLAELDELSFFFLLFFVVISALTTVFLELLLRCEWMLTGDEMWFDSITTYSLLVGDLLESNCFSSESL